MKNVSETSRDALEEIVRLIVDRLYLDLNPLGCPQQLRDHEVYNPDKDWDIDDLAYIAELLQGEELTPEFLGDEPDEVLAKPAAPTLAAPPAREPPSKAPPTTARRGDRDRALAVPASARPRGGSGCPAPAAPPGAISPPRPARR